MADEFDTLPDGFVVDNGGQEGAPDIDLKTGIEHDDLPAGFELDRPQGPSAMDLLQSQDKQPGFLDRAMENFENSPYSIFSAPHVAIGENALSMASGLASIVPSGLSGGVIAGAEGNDAGVQNIQDVSEAMTFQPRSQQGQSLLSGIGSAGQFVQQGTQDAIFNEPPFGLGIQNPLAATALQTTLEAGPALAGMRRQPITPRQTLATKAHQRGYVIDPVATNPASGTGIAEGFGGVQKTRRSAAIRNQAVTDDIIRKRYDIPEGAAIDVDSLSNVRKIAGQDYERIRGAGKIDADTTYRRDISAATKKFKNNDFDLADEVGGELRRNADNMAKRSSFDADSAVDQMSLLRDKADAAYRAGDKSLGAAWKELSNALESAIERDLIRRLGGNNEIVANYRAARQRIAETYSVQKALDGGSVSAVKLGQQLTRGVPLSDDLKLIGQLGSEFSPIFRKIKDNVAAFSPLDLSIGSASAGAAIAGGLATGSPAVAAGALLPLIMDASRPMLRSLALSRAGQGAATVGRPVSQGGLLGSSAIADRLSQSPEQR